MADTRRRLVRDGYDAVGEQYLEARPVDGAELHRVLRRGGLALLCLGANDLVDDHDPDSWLGAPMYWSHFDASTNVAMLERVGFHLLWRRVVSDPMDHGEHLFVLGARA